MERQVMWLFLLIALLILDLFILFHAIRMIYMNYVFCFSKNMKRVEQCLEKSKKRVHFSVLIDLLNGHFEAAAHKLNRVKSKRLRMPLKVSLHIERKNIDEAKKAAKQIGNPLRRYYCFAVIAILQNDWTTYASMKNKIKRKNLLYILEAEASFRKGNMEQAERFGDLAISTSSGLQRFICIKSLERQKNNPNRESYF